MFISRGKTKRRMLPGPSLLLMRKAQSAPDFTSYPGTFALVSTNGTQITESDGNRWPLPKGKSLEDIGSEFFSLKQEILTRKFEYLKLFIKGSPQFGIVPSYMEGNFMVVGGAFEPSSVQSFAGSRNANNNPLWPGGYTHDARLLKLNFPPDLSSSRAQLVVKGQIAVAACAPSNQIANAASAVGELLQDVPNVPGAALWKSRLRAAETLVAGSSEFLNGIFGVLPTMSDMTQFYTAVHKVDRTVDQFIRDSGRVVRRKFVFPMEKSTEEIEYSASGGYTYSPVGSNSDAAANLFSGLSPQAYPVWKTMRKRVIEREVWFSGAFTYHLPEWFDTHSREDRLRLTAKLLGAEPDLNTLWQLAPWSWAVDWFVNAGTWVKSLQALISYGTILRYGYVMETTTITDTYSAGDVFRPVQAGAVGWISQPYPRPQPITLRTTVKKRVQANPFGFGISWDGLSPIQQAIVAALGITRVVR